MLARQYDVTKGGPSAGSHASQTGITRQIRRRRNILARIEDIPQPTRDAVVGLECTSLDATPFVVGRPLPERRVAIISSAALFARSDVPFTYGAADFRELPASLPAGEILMSHVSINFDRTGWQRDINVIYPIDRLAELAAEGVVGSVARTHFSVLGSTDPILMDDTADGITARLMQDGVDAVVLSPV